MIAGWLMVQKMIFFPDSMTSRTVLALPSETDVDLSFDTKMIGERKCILNKVDHMRWLIYDMFTFWLFFPSFMIIHFVNISYVFHFFNQDTLDFTGYERMPWIRNEREKKN